MSREHFVPKCLWTTSRPQGTITVPAHVKCNQAFSDDNDYFRFVLANDYGAQFNPKAMEAFNGPIRRIMMWRRGQFDRYTPNFFVKPQYSEMGLFLGNRPSFPIDMERMYRVVRNITRGIYFVYRGTPLNPTEFVKVSLVVGEDDPDVIFKESMIPWEGLGDDGVFAFRLAMGRGIGQIACLMKFYGYRYYFAYTNPAID